MRIDSYTLTLVNQDDGTVLITKYFNFFEDLDIVLEA